MKYLMVSVVLVVSLAGCAPANRDQLVKEVLRADPEFSAVLDKHQQLQNRLTTHERELALARDNIEQKIKQLRRDLAIATANARAKSADVKSRIEPDRERLRLDLAMAGEELKAKRAQRAALGGKIAELRKALKSSGENWGAKERAAREAEINDMLRDTKRLDQELATMKEHVRLLKIKLVLIKL